ncbi:MAG: ABC transporter permease [Microbacterium sp.]
MTGHAKTLSPAESAGGARMWPTIRDSLTHGAGLVGTLMLTAVLLVAIIGPFVAPSGLADVVGIPLTAPNAQNLLGTDILGRDVLSRVLHGGAPLLLVSLGATLIAYAVGSAWAIIAVLRWRMLEMISLALVDIVLSLPPLIVGLVMLAGGGSGNLVIALALAVIQVPRVYRIVRAAAREQSVLEYVEFAQSRGDSVWTIMGRDILVNIRTPMLADFGIRLTSSVILFSSLSFLGLGAPPPASDWGIMISENRTGILLQPWGVLVPAVLIAVLSIAVNMMADAYSQRSQNRG